MQTQLNRRIRTLNLTAFLPGRIRKGASVSGGILLALGLAAQTATAEIKMVEYKSGTNLLVCVNPKCIRSAHVQRGKTTAYRVYGDNVDWATSVSAGAGITVALSEKSATILDRWPTGRATLTFTVSSTASPGSRTVRINWRNAIGMTGSETFTITVLRNPVVTSVTPTTVQSGRTTALTISGSDLGGAKVAMGASATAMNITSNSESQIALSGTWPSLAQQKTDMLRIGQNASALLSIKAADIVILPDPTTPVYAGCFADGSTRVLDGYTMGSSSLTNRMCRDTCKQRGFKYAGTEYSTQCFCGNARPPQARPNAECNMACSGSSSEMCGGSWRLTVWQWP